jgi:hypothetical protein
MRRTVLMFVLAAAAGVPAAAHHSFAAYYFEEQSVTIEGVVTEFRYGAPHAWVYLDAPDARGQTQRFSAEWANPNRLSRDGITKDTLQPGDRVIITGSPGREPAEYKVHLKGIERPSDGWAWRPGRRR